MGLTVTLLLTPRVAIADDDVTLKRILQQAQSEAEISAAKTFIETLTGSAQEFQPESVEALSQGRRSQDIGAETQTKGFAQPAASTAYEPASG